MHSTTVKIIVTAMFCVSDKATIAAKSAIQATNHRNEDVIEEECEIKIPWPVF